MAKFNVRITRAHEDQTPYQDPGNPMKGPAIFVAVVLGFLLMAALCFSLGKNDPHGRSGPDDAAMIYRTGPGLPGEISSPVKR